MKKKRIRKCYLSCRQVKKEDYQKTLMTRFSIIFVKSVDEAELVLLPRDEGTLTQQQVRDLRRATDCGINCWILSPQTILNMDTSYPLETDELSCAYDLSQQPSHDYLQEEELEMVL